MSASYRSGARSAAGGFRGVVPPGQHSCDLDGDRFISIFHGSTLQMHKQNALSLVTGLAAA